MPDKKLEERCPLCEGELKGTVQMSLDNQEHDVVVIDCQRCGRFRMPEPAVDVLHLTGFATRFKLGRQLQQLRQQGDDRVVDLSALGFVHTDIDLTETERSTAD